MCDVNFAVIVLTKSEHLYAYLFASVTALRTKFIGLYTRDVLLSSSLLNVFFCVHRDHVTNFESIFVFVQSTYDHIHALTCHLECYLFLKPQMDIPFHARSSHRRNKTHFRGKCNEM